MSLRPAGGIAAIREFVTTFFRIEGRRVLPDPAVDGANRPNPTIADAIPDDLAELARRYGERRVDIFLSGEKVKLLQDLRIGRAVQAFLDGTKTCRGTRLDVLISRIREFQQVYLACPVTGNQYGVNYPAALNLFLIARSLSPSLVVESGVYKGLSTHILAAACPNARILAFDPNLREVTSRAPRVEYREHDWMSSDADCRPVGSGLCFFDDHQNQASRLLQAHQRGFRHLLYDDSWPIEAVNGCGWPPLPSIDMVVGDPLEIGQTVNWVESGKLWTYVHTREMETLCSRARRLIKAAYEVPSLYRETGIAPSSAFKFVELV